MRRTELLKCLARWCGALGEVLLQFVGESGLFEDAPRCELFAVSQVLSETNATQTS